MYDKLLYVTDGDRVVTWFANPYDADHFCLLYYVRTGRRPGWAPGRDLPLELEREAKNFWWGVFDGLYMELYN